MLLAILVTVLNTFFGAFITPFLPYEVLAFAAFMPADTARLNLDLVFFALTVTSVNACSNLILSILPLSSADSNSCCPGCVCKAPYPNAAPAAYGNAAD